MGLTNKTKLTKWASSKQVYKHPEKEIYLLIRFSPNNEFSYFVLEKPNDMPDTGIGSTEKELIELIELQ